ncbi:MAG TPA: hypothetical protein VLJ59_05255 [Mycobacteriales bacterium]|nr:hypothetical protein [Mycobacteriales bacterium]
MIRHLLAALTLAIGVIAQTAVASSPASASLDLVICPAYLNTTYTPGLTFTERPTSFNTSGALGPCVSSDLTHTSGTYTAEGNGSLSCVGGSTTGSGQIAWNGNRHSDFTFTGAISLRPSGETVLVITGTITSGDYTGHTLTEVIVLATTQPTDCFTVSGLTSVSGPLVFTIT